MSLRENLAKAGTGKAANVSQTQYRGEILRIGRFAIQVRGGVLIVCDEAGTRPQFTRPKKQPETIVLQPGRLA